MACSPEMNLGLALIGPSRSAADERIALPLARPWSACYRFRRTFFDSAQSMIHPVNGV